MIKGMPLTVKGLRGFQEAVITRGGVDVKQVSPSTMQSRLIEGLFFAGEVLDVDALTGGFNLQIAVLHRRAGRNERGGTFPASRALKIRCGVFSSRSAQNPLRVF